VARVFGSSSRSRSRTALLTLRLINAVHREPDPGIQQLRGSTGAHQGLDSGPADQLRGPANRHAAIGLAEGDGHRGRTDSRHM
jgi:hypothetical protein